MTTRTTRRVFLSGTAAAAAGGLVARPAPGAQEAPSERINIAVMGINGRGRALAEGFAGLPGAVVSHVCDVDTRLFDDRVAAVADRQGRTPGTVVDFREVLDDPSVDALAIAAPDHWHAPATVMACQAGKHVYVEKPASHTLWEGRQMVEAARKYGRVVQVGTQSRSATHYHAVMDALRGGRIGDVLQATAWNSQRRGDLIPWIADDLPEGVDYDLWLGPAPERQFSINRFHYTWHWFWDYGTGDVGNDGIHDIDIARWGLDVGLPETVACTALKARNTHWETPDTVVASFTFPGTKKVLTFEQRDWAPYTHQGFENGVAFRGTEGFIEVGRSGWRLFEGNDPVPVEQAPMGDEAHLADFLDAVKAGRRPNADIEEGHRSASLAHLINIAFRAGRNALRFDPESEAIVGDDEARALARRAYREPFGVPERV